MVDTTRLKDKVIVITGAASGIGRACAIRYALEGAKVILADINLDLGVAVTKEITDNGGQAIFLQTDVSLIDQLDALLKQAINVYGKVDIWHNNAFTSVFKPIYQQTLAEFDETIRISLRAYWYGSKIAVEHLMERGAKGVILHTASVQSYFGERGFSAYQVAKGGILSLARSIGVDCAPLIRSVAIAPGFITTPAHDEIPLDILESVKARIPIKRAGEPEEVAALAAYLASDEADYITATGIIIDGGDLAV